MTSRRNRMAAHKALQDLIQDEVSADPPDPHRDRLQVFHDRAILYLKYLQIFRNLEEVFEQLVQPQRKKGVRVILDGLMGRLLELKAQMVDLDRSEFHCFDEVLLDLKMTPKDLQIPVPRFFLTERNKQMTIDVMLEKRQRVGTVSLRCQVLSLEEAVHLLQVSERARQGRIRAQVTKELKLSERGFRRLTWRATDLEPHQAAIRIQKVWRGFMQRKKTDRERRQEMEFLGMIPAEIPGPGPAQLQDQLVSTGVKLIQDQNEEEYQRVQLSIKQSVLNVEGTDMKETLQDQIRQWFLECRDATGRFPDFPHVDHGGSASLFTQKSPEQVLVELSVQEDQEKKKKKEKIGNRKQKKKKTTQDERRVNGSSCFLTDVAEGHRLYKDVLRFRDNRQVINLQLLREEKRREVEQEVRVQVDELMRAELSNLKLVVDRTKMKTRTRNKEKKKKKTKKKKDLTADRSLQSLCEELILNEFLIKPQTVRLSEFIGEFSYLGSTLRQANNDPAPSLSDVRQLVTLYAVLPLGSQAILKKFPLVKTLLLAGPSGVGKTMLVHGVCNETGAHLFHLSPKNLNHSYPGKRGATYLLHLVFKVAGELQPSVIWIEDAEKTFCKKKTKSNQQFDLQRLKKELLRSLKTLKPEDRVLVIGTTQRPFDAKVKPFCKVYKKIILIPKPDYSSRLALWTELLHAEGVELGPSLDLSSLAKITDGFTPGHILKVIRSVLRPHRLKKLRLQPLMGVEFVQSLSRMEPVYKEEEKAFKVWFRKTPLGRKRLLGANADEDKRGNGKKKQKRQTTKTR
ncbi:dynein regulatory complex protein 11-like isoform X2 [Anabas testudineus]|uniref:dynein regulatory complex protein 11-like isoform X2 n=1 Tax=Anabas testudineus TaxID=64144 RepID=UPI000E4573E5|nr:dynein regulatory complex protein 11-like isoform X2 [Anabas testudineus]